MTDGGFNPVAFGRLEERVENLSTDMVEVRGKLDEILAAVNRGKGARWGLGAIIALISSGTTEVFHQIFHVGGK